MEGSAIKYVLLFYKQTVGCDYKVVKLRQRSWLYNNGTLTRTTSRDGAPLSVCGSNSCRSACGSGCGHFLLNKLYRAPERVGFELQLGLRSPVVNTHLCCPALAGKHQITFAEGQKPKRRVSESLRVFIT